jgi:hypothetical protein
MSAARTAPTWGAPERGRRGGGSAAPRSGRLAFGRESTATERAAAVAPVRGRGPAALCQGLYHANEFLNVD